MASLAKLSARTDAAMPSATHCPAAAASSTQPGTRHSAIPSMLSFKPRLMTAAAAESEAAVWDEIIDGDAGETRGPSARAGDRRRCRCGTQDDVGHRVVTEQLPGRALGCLVGDVGADMRGGSAVQIHGRAVA